MNIQPPLPLPPLRPFQSRVLQILSQKKPFHAIVTAPTGSGKTRIFAELARQNRILVFSPLVALTRQHVETLQSAKIPCWKNPDRPPSSARTGAWILSPETLFQPKTIAAIKQFHPFALVVDECHVIWDWGHTFRPAFLQTFNHVKEIQNTLWLTATLSPTAAQTIEEGLRAHIGPDLQILKIEENSLPSNLVLRRAVSSGSQKTALTFNLISHHLEKSNAGILIYTSTRNRTESLTKILRSRLKLPIFSYHAGLAPSVRREIEIAIKELEGPYILISTSAFGMGMDIPSLETAIIFDHPAHLMALAQIAGRVGRRSLSRDAMIWLLYDTESFRFLDWQTNRDAHRSREYETLHQFYEQNQKCRKMALMALLKDKIQNNAACGRCDVCVNFTRASR